MFEESENSFPVKPDLILNHPSNNRNVFLFIAVIIFVFSSNLITDFYVVLLEIGLVFLIHELGHYAMMRAFRSKGHGMFLLSFLGRLTKQLKPSLSLKQQTVINLMGPLPGVVIGCGLFVYLANTEPNYYVIELGLLFLGINLINLVPIDPFDGGRIIGGFFFYKNDQLRMGFTLFSSLTLLLVGVILKFWPLIIFGFLMGLKVRGFQKSSQLHDELNEAEVDYKKEYKDLTNREYWLIRKAFLQQNPKLNEMIPSDFALWENERLLVDQVKQILRADVKSDIPTTGKIAFIGLMTLLVAGSLLLVLNNYDLIQWYLENVAIQTR